MFYPVTVKLRFLRIHKVATKQINLVANVCISSYNLSAFWQTNLKGIIVSLISSLKYFQGIIDVNIVTLVLERLSMTEYI